MKKNTIITFTIISIVVTLVYILVMYFGIYRYITLHRYKCEDYIKNYNILSQHDTKEIDVVLTSNAKNITSITPVINSILDQTVKVHSINVIVPDGLEEQIPKESKNYIFVHKILKDYGELNAVIPSLLKLKDTNELIIVIKDDKIYGKDFIEEMIDVHEKHPNNILVSDKMRNGMLLKPDFFKNNFDVNYPKNIDKFIKQNAIVDTKNINYFEIYKKI